MGTSACAHRKKSKQNKKRHARKLRSQLRKNVRHWKFNANEKLINLLQFSLCAQMACGIQGYAFKRVKIGPLFRRQLKLTKNFEFHSTLSETVSHIMLVIKIRIRTKMHLLILQSFETSNLSIGPKRRSNTNCLQCY